MDQQLPHSLKKTPLHALHLKLGAAMMPFAGYEMPLQFASIKQEHLHTRQQAGLFDVSHMGLFRLSGPDAAGALERLVPADIKNLPLGKQRYTLLLNQDGGIVDDLMITHTYQGLLLVVNAGCKIKDRDFLNTHLQGDCRLDELNQFSLLAVQGPQAARVLSRYHPAIAALPFMTGKYFTLMNHECFSSRCGYCGEDGYELVIANDALENVAVKLLDNAEVKPAGLGARDTLRLEAGLCLYGHELDETISPVEANLKWTISRTRLQSGAAFFGIDRIKRELDAGPKRLRAGLLVQGKIPVREKTDLLNDRGECVGHVTSGGFAPSLGTPVAMALLDSGYAGNDTILHAVVRGKKCSLRVIPLPFLAHRYYRH